jgi:hypothetical protein
MSLENLSGTSHQVVGNTLIINSTIPDSTQIEWEGDLIAKAGAGNNVTISGVRKFIMYGDIGSHFDFSGNGAVMITGKIGELGLIETMGEITLYGDAGCGCYFYTQYEKITITGAIGEGTHLFSPAICTGTYSANVIMNRLHREPPEKAALAVAAAAPA